MSCLPFIAGVLSALSFFAPARNTGANTFFPFPEKPATQQEFSPPSSKEKYRKRAEAAIRQATILQQKQTRQGSMAAIQWFQTGTRLFQAAQLSPEAAKASLQSGEIYLNLSNYDRALASFRQARALGSKSPDLLCLALSRIARVYAVRGENVEAETYSSQALEKCSVLQESRLQAEGMEARGEALYNTGETVESEQFFSRARELFEAAGDKRGQARALLMLAYDRYFKDRSQAVQLAGEALQVASASIDTHAAAEVRTALGIFATATDEFETAQCNYQRALPVFHNLGDKDNEAIILNGMGFASRETGDIGTSLAYYTRANALFTTVRDRLGAGEAVTGMGKALRSMGRYQALLPLYYAKLRLARMTRSAGLEASTLADLAATYELQHHYAKAQTFYQKALAAYSSAKRDYGVADVLTRLALLDAREGNDAQAITLLEKVLLLRGKTGQAEATAAVHYELANIYRRLGRLEEARAAIEKTIDIIESQRLKIANFDSRAAYFSSVHRYYALYIQILMLLNSSNPHGGFAQLAFEASEKSKVRALLDLLNAAGQGSSCEDLLEKQLRSESAADSRSLPSARAASMASVLTLQQIQAEIGRADTMLIEYALGDERSYVWFVDSNQVIAHQLPSARTIKKLARAFRATLMSREPRPGDNLDGYRERVGKADRVYPRLARELSQLLLGPMDPAHAKRLLIVPDGPLQYIPFSALQVAETGESDTMLMSHHELVILPSASALGALRRVIEKRAAPTATAVIVADPVVDQYDPRVHRGRSAAARPQEHRSSALQLALRDVQSIQLVTRLPGSQVEAETIRQMLGAPDVLLESGFKASRNYVVQGGLARYRIIHFATHGLIDAEHPEMSGLILSLVNDKGQSQDGYLRLGDIYKLKLSADLVVLSACNSALGKNMESEGTIGLPRGFLEAGAKSVIASLWKVDDRAAVDFMKYFYLRIHQGESPGSALQGAQRDIVRSGHWVQPFYWAAFVLQGDYE